LSTPFSKNFLQITDFLSIYRRLSTCLLKNQEVKNCKYMSGKSGNDGKMMIFQLMFDDELTGLIFFCKFGNIILTKQ